MEGCTCRRVQNTQGRLPRVKLDAPRPMDHPAGRAHTINKHAPRKQTPDETSIGHHGNISSEVWKTCTARPAPACPFARLPLRP
eukprot:6734963-Prymnesium_polylepis.1